MQLPKLLRKLHHHDWDWAGDVWNAGWDPNDWDAPGHPFHETRWRCRACGETRVESKPINDGTPAGAMFEAEIDKARHG